MRLLVKNTQNSYLTGDVLVITEDGHSFGRWESKNVFLNTLKESESPLDWPNHFVIVNVPGVPKDLYQYLLDDLIEVEIHNEEVIEFVVVGVDDDGQDIEEAVGTGIFEAKEHHINKGRHFYLEPQGPTSQYWEDLRDHGEVTISQSELEAVIRSRV